MVGCSILGCKSRSERKIDRITFHSFPANIETKNTWVIATGRENWEPTNYSKICSRHFYFNAFDFKEKKVQLKPFSIPKKHVHIKNFTNQSSTSYGNIKTDYFLQEVQNIQPKRLLADSVTSGNTITSKLTDPQNIFIATNKKQVDIKKLLTTEKSKASKRLKKLRALRESKRRLIKKTAHLVNIIDELQCKMRMSHEELDLLSNIETGNIDFLKRFLDKENSPRKYSPSLRKFAICLHFISPKAYNFVRSQFDTCLPHPKTLYRWYKCINCEPGFTKESFEAIKLIVGKSRQKILCCISLDEMSIRQHLQWNGKQTVGYMNLGENLDCDNLPLAKDALVFMATSLNDSWKIPIGYFLTNVVNGEQRSALLRNCVYLLTECGVQIVSVTFDGCPANFAMARILGAHFDDIYNINPEIVVEGQKLVIFPDPCHMLKLVRNSLADKNDIYNCNHEKISWDYIVKLHNLQQNEGLHLANKLRNAHLNFKKQIMKVRLAAQTFSKSVADALSFCKNDLGIDDFLGVGATIQFINYFNDIFDIFNSRKLSSYEYKKPVMKDNFQIIHNKLKEFEEYVIGLKFAQNEPVIKSGRKTGFVGFIICIKAVRIIYYKYINVENAPLQYLCTYKMSQDHLELFFSAIRSKGGFNNNPTALQFMSAYKRLLIHGELKNITTGNCIPLESVNRRK